MAVFQQISVHFFCILSFLVKHKLISSVCRICTTRMSANAQRDGRPAEYTWRPLFNAAKFGCLQPTTRVSCSNAAKMQNPLKSAWVPQTRQQISAASRPNFTILWGHVAKLLLHNKFFFRLSIHALVAKIQPDKVVGWCPDGDFLRAVFSASRT